MSSTSSTSVFQYLLLIATITAVPYLGYQIFNQITAESRKVKQTLARRLKRPELENIDLSSHESSLCRDVVSDDEVNVSFNDIGGMEHEIEEIKDHVILPMQMWKLFRGQSNISPCPTGVLLYGKPGTGKTLMAKAIAKECGATFLSIKASSIMDKYYGESDKLVSAIFSLAKKLAPTVIFIDEIDTVLKKRTGSEMNQALHSMQGVFLTEWDGLQTTSSEGSGAAPVILVGATNRPSDLDKAFLRRMPVSVQTSVPDLNGRLDIIRKQLARETVAENVNLEDIASRTEGFTGSEIRELIRVANLQRVKEMIDSIKASGGNASKPPVTSTAPITIEHFEYALTKTKITDHEAVRYETDIKEESKPSIPNSEALLGMILSLLNAK